MKGSTIILAGFLSFSGIMPPAQSLDVPAVCEVLDPREMAYSDPYRMSSRAIATAKEQYQSGQGDTAAQTLNALVAHLQELDADVVEPADQILGAYFRLHLAEVYVEIQRPKPAFALLESALEQSLQPRYLRPFQIVSRAAELYARAGEFDRAWILVNTPLPPGRDVDAYYGDGQASVRLNTAQFYLDSHKFEQAEATIELIQEIDYRYGRYYIEGKILLIEYLIAQGELNQAASIADSLQAIKEPSGERFVAEYRTALVDISKAHIAIGQAQLAQQIFDPLMPETQAEFNMTATERWSILVEFSRAYTAVGQTQLARQILEIITSEMQGEFDVDVLLDMTDAYIELNDLFQAKAVLTQIIQQGNEQREDYKQEYEEYLTQNPSPAHPAGLIPQYEHEMRDELGFLHGGHRYVLFNVAKRYWQLGETELYQETLEAMLSTYIVSDELLFPDRITYRNITKFLIETEQLELALSLLKSGDVEQPEKNRILIMIIEGFLIREDYDRALSAAYELEDSNFHRWKRRWLVQELSILEELIGQGEYDQVRLNIERWNERFSWANDLKIDPDHWISFVQCHHS
ncbi:MAG: hypothetical protein AAGG51_18680 [Cyanobacteria bacterium P01_G01_bin.54]